MIFKTPSGRTVTKFNLQKYRIDWDKPSRSNPQFRMKQFLRCYWGHHIVYEEFPVIGSKMKIDFFNQTKMLVIEVDGKQHNDYVKHFHGSPHGFWRQIKKDEAKERFCEVNDINLIRVLDTEVKDVSVEFFEEKFGITIF